MAFAIANQKFHRRDTMKNTGLASSADRTRNKRMTNGEHPFQITKSEWMETGRDPVLSPTAFLIEQPPHASLHTHWHGENQFQVFVQGSGSIGKDTLGPYTVHYAGAYTGYGPILAGDNGLSYFTLRAVYELGSKKKIEDMVRGPKRHAVGGPHTPLSAQALRAITEVQTLDLIALAPDGLCARVLRIPPGGSVRGLAPAGSGGQFYKVLEGGLADDGRTLGHWETVFLSADEPALDVRASADGLEVLFLQLPPKEAVYIAAQEQERAAKALAATAS